MSNFQKNGYEIVHNVISNDSASILASSFEQFYAIGKYNNWDFKGDHQVDKSFAFYAFLPFEALLEHILPTMERITQKDLIPTYSYARIYFNGAELLKHKDRPSCQYSATMTLSMDETPWEIYMDNFKGEAEAAILPVGSMIAYCGDKLTHWREPYKGKKQVQVFLHYVDKNGEYADCAFDGRPMLGMSADTSSGRRE